MTATSGDLDDGGFGARENLFLEPQLCCRHKSCDCLLFILKPVAAGDNYYGQLGLGDSNSRGEYSNEMGDFLPAVSLGTGLTATAITCGAGHTCALLSNGQLKCWGVSRILLSLP